MEWHQCNFSIIITTIATTIIIIIIIISLLCLLLLLLFFFFFFFLCRFCSYGSSYSLRLSPFPYSQSISETDTVNSVGTKSEAGSESVSGF
jgi:flagellar basal body-associated protein FliL